MKKVNSIQTNAIIKFEDYVDSLKQKDDLLVVFDIDGTLTNKNGLVLDVIKIIRKIKSKVVFASGRNLTSLFFFARDAGRKDAILIGENGGVYQLPEHSNEVLVLKNRTMKKVIQFLLDNQYVSSKPEHSHTRLSDHMFNKTHVLKPIIEINAALNEKFKGKFCMTDSGSAHIHLHSKKITKGHTLSKICKHYNIPKSKVIVFGNADNDLEMFARAKISVCVDDRSKQLQDCANYVAKNQSGLGVIEGLLIYLFKVPVQDAINYVNQL